MTSVPPEKILLVTHSEQAEPGAIRAALHARGYETVVCCPVLGDGLPALSDGRPEGFAGAIVFGGPMCVTELEKYPFLQEELAWMKAQIQVDAPVLGVCLGAQLMAAALGARVFAHPEGKCEIGYHEIYPAQERCDLFREPFHVYQWHREGFDLPEGATLLATASIFENQAFQYGERAFAIQFHPEMTPVTLERWVTNEKGRRYLSWVGAQAPDDQRASASLYDPAVHAWIERFLDKWLGAN